jgi:hypothetical protein
VYVQQQAQPNKSFQATPPTSAKFVQVVVLVLHENVVPVAGGVVPELNR